MILPWKDQSFFDLSTTSNVFHNENQLFEPWKVFSKGYSSVREMFSFNENAESLTCLCLFFSYKLKTFDL